MLEIQWIRLGKGKGYDTATEAWVNMIPDVVVRDANASDQPDKFNYIANAADNTDSGKGYSVFSNSAGVIVPQM